MDKDKNVDVDVAFEVIEALCSGDPLHSKAIDLIKQEFIVMKNELEQVNYVTKQIKEILKEEMNVQKETIKLQ